MGYGSSQLDVAHTLSTDTCLCHFYAAAVADNTFITNLFIFTAMTLPVLTRPEDSLTEQTVLLGLKCPVVDGLRLLHLAMGPLQNLIRGGQTNLNGIKCHWMISFISFWHEHLLPSILRLHRQQLHPGTNHPRHQPLRCNHRRLLLLPPPQLPARYP